MARQIYMLAAILGLLAAPSSLAQCPGDVDGDGDVGINDFLAMLGTWGPCPPAGACPADLDGDGQVGITDFLIVVGHWGPCPDHTSPAIVVYNLNYPDVDGNGLNDAQEIAEHYVEARGLHPSALCGVQLPTGDHATPEELLGARRTIVEDCICRAVAQDVQDDTECDIDNVGALESIRDASPIAHMVLIKGIPAHLFNVDWPDQDESDKQGPSFGFYLSYLLCHDADILADINLMEALPYSADYDSALGYVPPLNPADHHMLAFGWVEAVTKARTLDLIDRTIEAERAGVQGNILIESNGPFSFFDLTSAHDSACFDYLGDPDGTWPYNLCRVGSTGGAVVPGTEGSKVPFAIKGGLLYGQLPLPGPQAHSAFMNFATMLNWHKAEEGCVELCEDFATQEERDECKANSTDYYQQINTDCVGAAPGFMAYQLRSFAVQYYGFTPPGWRLARSSSFLKSMPLILEGAAYTDALFTDNRYAHFGAYDHLTPDTSTCSLADGTTIPCSAHLAVNLGKMIIIDNEFIGDDAKQHTLTFRYRYTETPGQPPAILALRLSYGHTQGAGNLLSSLIAEPIADSTGGWNTVSRDFSVGPVSGDSITDIKVELWSIDEDGNPLFPAPTISGFLDLDGFELVDADTQENVFPVDVGSFAYERNSTTAPGEWPANVIDRLNGIANWGQGTHHSPPSIKNGQFPGAFFAGRTLGEAWAHTNGGAGPSGLAYGDPLYRPSAVKISASDFVDVYQLDRIGDPRGYDVWNDTYEALNLRIHVLHGTDNQDTTRWEIFTCPDLGLEACDGNWTLYDQGIGAEDGLEIGGLDDLIDTDQDQTLTLKLRVWNEGDEGNDLSNYAYFKYWAHPLPDCPGDANGDGVVGAGEQEELLAYWCPSWWCSQVCPLEDGFCIADVNQDGLVNIQDWLFVDGKCCGVCLPFNCQADINGDGLVDQEDLDLVELYWESCPIADGFCIADVDQDGVVGSSDLLLVVGNWGPCEDPLDCPADVNGDGVVGQADADLVYLYWSCPTPCPDPYENCPVDEDTGFCVYDLDQDGDVDETDYNLLILGPCPT